MSHAARALSLTGVALAALALATVPELEAQASTNPYRADFGWLQLEGRQIGTVSGVQMDADGRHLWILDRCGGNGCVGTGLDPILQVDMEGRLVRSLGKDMFAFPHGFFIDHQGNIWVTEGAPDGDRRGEAGFELGMGHQVFKLDRDGRVLMTLGEAAVSGADESHFNGPTGVIVQDDGEIWVSDGHGGPQRGPNADNMFGSRGGNNRLVRFSADGDFHIVDLTSADAVRRADSLSGGETFLASLALALALAEMVARTGGRLDAFFLDEGFGSLDPEHLDLAMEGIEQLASGAANRLVLVVSHVAEMRHRIEDLIELDRDPVTGDTIVVHS